MDTGAFGPLGELAVLPAEAVTRPEPGSATTQSRVAEETIATDQHHKSKPVEPSLAPLVNPVNMLLPNCKSQGLKALS